MYIMVYNNNSNMVGLCLPAVQGSLPPECEDITRWDHWSTVFTKPWCNLCQPLWHFIPACRHPKGSYWGSSQPPVLISQVRILLNRCFAVPIPMPSINDMSNELSMSFICPHPHKKQRCHMLNPAYQWEIITKPCQGFQTWMKGLEALTRFCDDFSFVCELFITPCNSTLKPGTSS